METREQTIARSLDRHIALTANAGSGKTRVLVNRYVDLLLAGVHPDEIIAITFTKKAAAEMLSRVAARIDNLYSNAETESDLKKLKYIREQLTGAKISTIHSFCAGLLRDYPIEAGVIPNFIELPAYDIIRMKNQAITETLEEWLDGFNPDKKIKATGLIEKYGLDFTKNNLESILNKPLILNDLIYLYTNNPIQNSAQSFLIKMIFSEVIKTLNFIKLVTSSIDRSKLKKDKLNNYNDINDKLNNISSVELLDIMNKYDIIESANNEQKIDNSREFDNNEEQGKDRDKCFIAILNKILEIIKFYYTNEGELRKRDIQDKLLNNELIDIAPKYHEITKLITSYIEAGKNSEFENDLIKTAVILLEIAEDANEMIEEEKSYAGGLDFNDMLSKAHLLLQNLEVRQRILKKVKYILVDEFQDTDSLQYDIVKALIPSLENPDSPVIPNLFIVGDAKQSIYSFRNADVRVFNSARNDIRTTNRIFLDKRYIKHEYKTDSEVIKPINDAEAEGDIALKASFRLQPVVAAFVNEICSTIMSDKKSDFDVDYEPLVLARNVEECFVNLSNEEDKYFVEIDSDEKKLGSVSMMILTESKDQEDEESEENISSIESAAIAAKIHEIVESESHLLVEEEGVFRKAR
ncbi:MAG: ATP-dependent helicase/nuclease subunit, partial [Bacteroidota bacterium]|nr:ATP-dependent helicase/nuclease subunit [Bacteroidota bacterium]